MAGWVCGLAAWLLAACATSVHTAPASFTAGTSAAGPQTLQLTQIAYLKLATGYARELPAGSRWTKVGAVAEGTVYQRQDGVFTVEGRQVHEAYLVVRDGVVHGFYLPGDGAFSPLTPGVNIR